MDCVFCAIATDDKAAGLVARDHETCAFLDARPLFKGHVLVIPAAHIATLGDLPPASIPPFFEQVQRVARALESALGADGAFLAINNRVSQSVPHLHMHVVPRHKGDGLRGFFWPRTHYASEQERDEYARRIREALAAMPIT